ncbi:AAA family ATPase [Methylonatrum kenyense]|uniref:ExeA family protein n=1 Tax=Methylonatrum kenyense TaxID=455253 RepID=UPI0020BF85EE|nr:AAA family ATPase [Methylonatrum kenyense]MCK8516822.1 AAA family ATPase [Methylonatrum kenyense]
MYLEHFRLQDFPFRLIPDSEFFFLSQAHARAKAYLEYTVMSRDGFVVITGEIGAGKTTLLNMLIDEFSDRVLLAHIHQSQLNDIEFLQAVLSAFGESISGLQGKVELLNRLQSFLEQQALGGRRVVLAVDEAQSLGYPALEQIRMLAGMEANKQKLLSIILVGQPELQQVIQSPNLEQLAQRIRLRFHLGPLSRDEAKDYIRHRLRIARAASVNLFTEGAYDAVDRYAGGIPRLINSLCDMALLTAFVEEREQVTAGIIEVAASELEWPLFEERGTGRRPMPGSAMAQLGVRDEAAPAGPGGLTQQQVDQIVGSITDGFGGLRRELRGIRAQLRDLLGRSRE